MTTVVWVVVAITAGRQRDADDYLDCDDSIGHFVLSVLFYPV